MFLTWQNIWYLLSFVAYILIRIITSFLILILLLFFFEKTQLVHASHATPSPPPRRFWSPIRIPVKLNLIKSVQFSKTGLEPLPPPPSDKIIPSDPLQPWNIFWIRAWMGSWGEAVICMVFSMYGYPKMWKKASLLKWQ